MTSRLTCSSRRRRRGRGRAWPRRPGLRLAWRVAGASVRAPPARCRRFGQLVDERREGLALRGRGARRARTGRRARAVRARAPPAPAPPRSARRAEAAPASARPLRAGDRRLQQPQLRQVHALAQFVRDLQRFLELRLRGIDIAGQQQRLRRIAEHLAGARRACRAGCSVRRPRGSGDSPRAAGPLRASAQPRNHRHAVRPCASENSSTSACISSASAATRSALPRRTSSSASCQVATRRVIGWRSSARAHARRCTCARPCCTRPRARARWPASRASVTCGSATNTVVRRKVERLGDREPALDPRACRLRPALQMVRLAVQEARRPASAPDRSTRTRALRPACATASACA